MKGITDELLGQRVLQQIERTILGQRAGATCRSIFSGGDDGNDLKSLANRRSTTSNPSAMNWFDQRVRLVDLRLR